MNSLPISILAILIYFIGGFLLARRLAQMPRSVPTKAPALVCGLLAVALHTWLLWQAIPVAGELALGFFNMVSLAAGSIALLLLLAALFRPVENLGIIVLPMAGVAVGFAQWGPESGTLTAVGPGLQLHIILSVLAYALLTIAVLQAVLLAIQEAHIRNRHPGGFIRGLPPMQTMEQLLFQILALGFILLSLSLISGFLFIDDLFAQHLLHKTILSLIAWSVFAVLFWGRYRFGWRGRTAIYWTLAGFVFLMLAYFGSKLVLELILQRV
jgi:ABC-type uncharacterized transport system permease subunit